MRETANYTAEIVEDFLGDVPSYVELLDVGPWDQYPTITNSAEAVVAQLRGVGLLGPDLDRRVFYRDSEGQRDELLHTLGVFSGFAPAREGAI